MLALLIALTSPTNAAMLRVQIDGMTCAGCQDKVSKAMNDLSFLSNTTASTASGLACASIEGEVDTTAVTAALAQIEYSVGSIHMVDACDPNTRQYPENWSDTDNLDVTIISRGETVTLAEHRVADKWTIFDFGAPWCAPCHAAETLLKVYLRDHPDLAVRAIVLDSQDAKESFAMPAAKQHLMSAPGLPYFVVMNAKGKVVFKGSEIEKLLKKMDKK